MTEPATAIGDRDVVRYHVVAAATEGRIIQSEWIKFWSVRSMMISFAAAASVGVALGAAFAASGTRPKAGARTDSASLSLAGFNISQLIIGILGVLFVSNEYSTGLIRTTLVAVRSRWWVLRAKVVVFGGATMAATAVAAFAAFFIGRSLYSGPLAPASLGDPGVVRALLGTATYVTGVGLLGLALGFLLRSTAAALGVLFGTFLVIPGLASLVSRSWSDSFAKVLPSNAGAALASPSPAKDLLSPGAAAVVFAAWVVGMLVLAGVALNHRDG